MVLTGTTRRGAKGAEGSPRRRGLGHTAIVGIAWRGPGRERRRRDDAPVGGIDDRLAAYAPSDDRSAAHPEEIRAGFRKEPEPEPEPDPQRAREFFKRQFTTESLFTWTVTPTCETVIDLRDPEDAYLVLGLPIGAPWVEVVRAHRSLARRHHPDHNVGSSEEARRKADVAIRNVNAAYELLQRRRQSTSSS